MKKFLITLLAIVYLTLPAGASINHDCMRKVTIWSMLNKNGCQCRNCNGAATHYGHSCYKEQNVFKTGGNQQASKSGLQFLPASPWKIMACYKNLFPILPALVLTDNTYGLFHPV